MADMSEVNKNNVIHERNRYIGELRAVFDNYKQKRVDWLRADKVQVKAMLKSIPKNDFAGKMSFQSRLKQINEELTAIEEVSKSINEVLTEIYLVEEKP